MCKVSSENIQMLRVFGTVFLAGGMASIFFGATYYRRMIRRDEEPFSYWGTTASLLAIGGLTLWGTVACVVK